MKTNNIFKIFVVSMSILFTANTFASTASDNRLSSKVKAQIAQDSTVAPLDVDVTTKNKVVLLIGTVDSQTQANTLVELAESVPGVRDVDTSSLEVKGSKQPMTDSAITAKVKGIFIREKLFGDADILPMSISVETNNGVVHLSGEVENKTQASNAVRLAMSIKGVKKVESRLVVKP